MAALQMNVNNFNYDDRDFENCFEEADVDDSTTTATEIEDDYDDYDDVNLFTDCQDYEEQNDTIANDMMAFERRLTEVIAYTRPVSLRWRIILIVVSMSTAIGAWQWIRDPLTFSGDITIIAGFLNHLLFTFSGLILGFLVFFAGIHNRMFTSTIIARRTSIVLADFNMSCDDNGRLAYKPPPPPHYQPYYHY